MKNTLLFIIALSLSVASFAGTKSAHKDLRKAAREACKSEGKTKKELKSCIKEKLNAPAPTESAAH